MHNADNTHKENCPRHSQHCALPEILHIATFSCFASGKYDFTYYMPDRKYSNYAHTAGGSKLCIKAHAPIYMNCPHLLYRFICIIYMFRCFYGLYIYILFMDHTWRSCLQFVTLNIISDGKRQKNSEEKARVARSRKEEGLTI